MLGDVAHREGRALWRDNRETNWPQGRGRLPEREPRTAGNQRSNERTRTGPRHAATRRYRRGLNDHAIRAALVELNARVAHIPKPALRIFLQASRDQALRRWRGRRREGAPLDVALQDAGDRVR
jgi:hypothetical protein